MKKILTILALFLSACSYGDALAVRPMIASTVVAPTSETIPTSAKVICAVDAARGDDGKLNLRSGPSLESPVLFVLQDGETVDVLSTSHDGWISVRARGTTGYLKSIYLECE